MTFEQQMLMGLLKSIPNGKTVFPMEFIINKMGANIELNIKMKLQQGFEAKPIDSRG